MMPAKNVDARSDVRPQVSRIRRLISACSLPDIAVWALVAKQVPICIEADEYLLICPAEHKEEFALRTPEEWTIAEDETFGRGFGREIIQQMAKGSNRRRAGWLLQQFVKINACADPGLAATDLVVIWDADTIPLRSLQFVDGVSGAIRYYHSSEHHAPYFETIRRALGIDTFAGCSFIAQCFATKAAWAREFVQHLEQRSGTGYMEHIVSSLPGVSESEFSEYETMGTWNLHHHRDEIVFVKNGCWTRNGARWIGHDPEDAIARFLLRLMALRYDYVAVEKWQPALRSLFNSRSGRPSTWRLRADQRHAPTNHERTVSEP